MWSRLGRRRRRRCARLVFTAVIGRCWGQFMWFAAPCPPGLKFWTSPFEAHIATEPDMGDGIYGACAYVFADPGLGHGPAAGDLNSIDNFVDRQSCASSFVDVRLLLLALPCAGLWSRRKPLLQFRTRNYHARCAAGLRACSGRTINRRSTGINLASCD